MNTDHAPRTLDPPSSTSVAPCRARGRSSPA